MLERWREPEPGKLVDLLLVVCDNHTHEYFQAMAYPEKQKDFALSLLFAWPIEIHMLFRLRQDIGLENPVLEHRLMQTGLASYFPPVPVMMGELLNKVTEKAYQEYPELREKIVV